jgi:dTMP kinase
MLDFNKPLLIVFEGIDGSGKTTLSKMLFKLLKKQGFSAAWFCEPSDSEYGKKIKEISRKKSRIPIEEELRYFIEDRKWNIKHNIMPALHQGQIIILDRYYFSTACYQGARGMDMQKIIRINREFAPEPDLILIIDVEVKTGLDRIERNRTSKVKLFERKSFLEKVRANYLKLTGDKIILIDGNPDPETVFSGIKDILNLK